MRVSCGTVVWTSCIGLSLCAGILRGAETDTETVFSLDAAVTYALENNADLNSLRAQWSAAREQPVQAGALPNPMFTVSGMDKAEGGSWPNTGEKRFMLEQSFPWFGKRTLRKNIALKEAEITRYELDSMTRDVVMEVKESYYDLYAIQRAKEIVREEQDVLGRMAEAVETMYGAGDRSQADVLGAQTEITMLKQRLLELDVQENTLQANMNRLMNRPMDSLPGPLQPPGIFEINESIEALLAMAATNRSDILSAQAQVERFGLEESLMGKEWAPDYALGVEYRNLTDSDNMAMAVLGVELPIWGSKNHAGVREAGQQQAAARAASEAAIRQSEFELRAAWFERETARRTLDLYQTELIPQAEARFDANEAGYRSGQVDFMSLLDSRRVLLNARIMGAMAEGSVGMQNARLERAAALVEVEP